MFFLVLVFFSRRDLALFSLFDQQQHILWTWLHCQFTIRKERLGGWQRTMVLIKQSGFLPPMCVYYIHHMRVNNGCCRYQKIKQNQQHLGEASPMDKNVNPA
ncbi:hypothetical protein F4775DRAFT_546761 [Biscogniauxia sp. FL1348]|nr:hypothetical protein F4775DRAFT_546761 [Biscogniauxia sp. FL1348]